MEGSWGSRPEGQEMKTFFRFLGHCEGERLGSRRRPESFPLCGGCNETGEGLRTPSDTSNIEFGQCFPCSVTLQMNLIRLGSLFEMLQGPLKHPKVSWSSEEL